jgi:transposase
MSKKRYGKMNAAGHIRGQQGLEFLSLTEDLAPHEILIVPLEVAKKVHWALICDGSGRILRSDFDFNALQAGLDSLATALQQAIERHCPRLLLIGMEPTGIYHEPLLHLLHAIFAQELARPADAPDLVVRLCYLDPAAVAANRNEKRLRFFKTDHVDLAAIADLLLRGEGFPARLPDPATLQLRAESTVIRHREKQALHLRPLMTSLVDGFWPGLILRADRQGKPADAGSDLDPLFKDFWGSQTARALMEVCPNPYEALRLGAPALRDLIKRETGVQRLGLNLTDKIVAFAQRAPLPPESVVEARIPALQSHLALFNRYQDDIQAAIARIEPCLATTAAQHIVAIGPGATPKLVAWFMGYLGDVSYFAHADQVWSKAGFPPIVYQSGGRFYHGQMAKNGSPGLRAATSILGRSLAAHCAYFGMTFMDACERGKSTKEAYVITAHKVVRVCFALLRDDVPFDPPLIDDYQAYEAQWRARQPAFRQWLRRRPAPHKRHIPQAGQRKKKRRR